MAFSILFFRSFTLFHDASHGTAHPIKWINNFVGYSSSIFCFLPFWPWRALHLAHHKWTGNIEKDPVLLILREFPKKSEKEQKFISSIWKSWIPLMAFKQYIVFWLEGHKIIDKTDDPSFKHKSLLSYALLLTAYSLVLFALGTLLLVNFLPSFICYLVMVEVINFPHHLALNNRSKNTPASPLKQYEYCRSCHHSFFVSYFFLCNFNYHTEHHMYPYLPWYQLHKIKDETEDELKEKYNKSNGINWIIKNRKKDFAEVMYGDNKPDSNKIAA